MLGVAEGEPYGVEAEGKTSFEDVGVGSWVG